MTWQILSSVQKRIPSCCCLYKRSPSPCWDLRCFSFRCDSGSRWMHVILNALICGACCWEGSKKIFCSRESAASHPCRRYWAVSFVYKRAAFSFLSVPFCARRYCFILWRNPAMSMSDTSPRTVSWTGSRGKTFFHRHGPFSNVVIVTPDCPQYFNIFHSKTCVLLHFLFQVVAAIHWHSLAVV